MQQLFEDLFHYQYHHNQQMIDYIQDHQKDITDKSYQLFCHLLNAHQIWNARVTGEGSIGIQDEHTLRECQKLDQQNYQNSLLIVKDNNLNNTVTYQNSKGTTFDNQLRDILFHIINHTTHHRAQIVHRFRQNDLTPPVTDYIFYQRKSVEP